jgi:outer membrane protein OmpA-like peptidoglycan-associated protein
MNTRRRTTLVLTLLATIMLPACNTIPPTNAQLEMARSDFRRAEDDPRAQTQAATEMKQAQDALALTNSAWVAKDDAERVNHLAYLTSQRVAIARETMSLKTAEQTVTNAGATRSNIRLEARTEEADNAQRNADASQRQAEAARRSTAVAQADTAAAQADTADAQRVAAMAVEQNRQLEMRLRELNARPSPRGLIMTIGDVLFDTDRAQLKPEGMRLLAQLVAVLQEFPQRTVLVEGFTDSTGSDSHNLTLSGKRADAVRLVLMEQGIDPQRVAYQGYGEAHPVADNATAQGRQLNRRVEIVLSNERGQIIAR